MKVTKKDIVDIESDTTRWLSNIPRLALSGNNIMIYRRDDLCGFISDLYYAELDRSWISSVDNSVYLNANYYLKMLIGASEVCYNLHATLAYDPKTWRCVVL